MGCSVDGKSFGRKTRDCSSRADARVTNGVKRARMMVSCDELEEGEIRVVEKRRRTEKMAPLVSENSDQLLSRMSNLPSVEGLVQTNASAKSEKEQTFSCLPDSVDQHLEADLEGSDVSATTSCSIDIPKAAPLSPGKRAERANWLTKRFASTIAKAQGKSTLESISTVTTSTTTTCSSSSKDEVSSKVKNCKITIDIIAPTTAADDDMKRKLELQRQREAARKKIAEMRNTTGIHDNLKAMNDFEMLCGRPPIWRWGLCS